MEQCSEGLSELSLYWACISLLSSRIHQIKTDVRVTNTLGKMIFKSYNLRPFSVFSLTSFQHTFRGWEGSQRPFSLQIAMREMFARISVNTLVIDITIQLHGCRLAQLKFQFSSLAFPKLPHVYEENSGEFSHNNPWKCLLHSSARDSICSEQSLLLHLFDITAFGHNSQQC